MFYLQVESRYGIFPNWPKIPGPKNRELRGFTIFLIFLFSQSTGLVTSASSRHMEPMSNSNGISLDELAGRGNFIPRPQADVKMRWFYDLFFRRKNKFTKDVGSNSQNCNLLKIIYCLGTHLLLKIISGSIFLMHM